MSVVVIHADVFVYRFISHAMLKYTGYVMNIDDARRFAEKQGIEVGPAHPAYGSILSNKLNVWLERTARLKVRAIEMDVKKGNVPLFRILWITRIRDGPSTITEYDEEPEDVAVKECWFAAEGFQT